jgi:hypothetical protein
VSARDSSSAAPFPAAVDLRACPGFGGLREALTQLAQVLQLTLAELGVPLREVLQRLVEPLVLVLAIRANDSARHDMMKQLIPRLLERRRTDRTALF